MKLLKIALKLSLCANIVLIFWVLSQRTRLLEYVAEEEIELNALDRAIGDVKQANRDLTRQELRMIAEQDQLDAYLEEHENHVH
jgi:hypothetical protein